MYNKILADWCAIDNWTIAWQLLSIGEKQATPYYNAKSCLCLNFISFYIIYTTTYYIYIHINSTQKKTI